MKVAPRRSPFPSEATDNLKLDLNRTSLLAAKIPKAWLSVTPRPAPVKCLLRTTAAGSGDRVLIVDLVEATATHAVLLNSFFIYQNLDCELDLTLADGEMITATAVVLDCVLLAGRGHAVRLAFKPTLEGWDDSPAPDAHAGASGAAHAGTGHHAATATARGHAGPGHATAAGAQPDGVSQEFIARQLSDLMENVAAIELRQRQQSGSEADLAKALPNTASVTAGSGAPVPPGAGG